MISIRFYDGKIFKHKRVSVKSNFNRTWQMCLANCSSIVIVQINLIILLLK